MSWPWLPPEALTGEAVQSPIERAVEAWSAAWFAGRVRLQVRRLELEPESDVGKAAGASSGASAGAVVTIPEKSLSRFRARALQTSEAARVPGAGEAKLLRGFDQRMLANLGARIEGELGIANSETREDQAATPHRRIGGPVLSITIAGLDASETARVEVFLDHVIEFRKRLLPRPRPRAPLAKLSSALAATRVSVSASLGAAQLSLGELNALRPGDVIILDKDLGMPAEVLAGPNHVSLGRARLNDADPITLVLE